MYELTQNITYLRVQKEQIVAIIESINQPMVAASGRALESTRAYIVGMRCASGLFSIYIYLHLLDSNDCLIFLHSPTEIPMEEYHEMELEALGFVESMGFIMDNLNFRNLDTDQQNKTMVNLPVFHHDLSAFAKTTTNQAESEVDLSPLEQDVIIELEEVAEDAQAVVRSAKQVVSSEGLGKIIRMLSSF